MNLANGNIFLNPKTNRLFTSIWLSNRTKLIYCFSFHTLRKVSAKEVLKVIGLSGAQKHLAHERISSTDKYLKVTEEDYLTRLSKFYKE
jgi:hypothetical protein